MGRRGPAPTPTVVKRARGETRPSRLRSLEPIPSGELTTPADLTPAAVEIWRRCLVAAPRGLITGADRDVFRCYVEAVERYEELIAWYARTGRRPILESKRADGPAVVRSPLVPMIRDAAEQVRLFGRELGFTPAARVGFRLDPAAEALAVWDDVGVPPRLALLDGR